MKVWVSLFTCLSTRAVHLEVVSDLSTECFLNCFKRFVSRRGLPIVICSDNGTTLKGASRFVDTLWEKLAGEESWQECLQIT